MVYERVNVESCAYRANRIAKGAIFGYVESIARRPRESLALGLAIDRVSTNHALLHDSVLTPVQDPAMLLLLLKMALTAGVSTSTITTREQR